MDKFSDDSQWINGTVLEIPSERCPVILDPLTRLNFRVLIGDILTMLPSDLSNGVSWCSHMFGINDQFPDLLAD